ncbi:glycosyltransferase family 4 protein [Patulibacter sp. SYSU D01012]|uniref:glycosyltransferase family 4 protein n=1 Tax=Patulibacter sp. SYSU D01012 TaxID=2817381 RepID=UPI001B311561|nr:glycosyltransferase family 4 protein [Patulibacter sp. SYSU D01012]
MRVAIATAQVPFVRGGAEVLAEGLLGALREHGAQVELVGLPFRWHPPDRLLDHLLAARLWRLDEADRVIGLKFPAYLVPHPDKVLWLVHQHRAAYDLWGDPAGGLPDTAQGRAVRDAVRRADDAWLPEARRVHTISPVVSDRLRRFNGIASTPLLPPLAAPGAFRAGSYGDYVFAPSRISSAKRQVLLVEAMRHVRAPVRLVLAGPAATTVELETLRAAVHRHGVADRVTLLPRWIPEPEKVELLAGALAVAFVPRDEDYGYVTLEAAAAGRATITSTDAGGPTLFVRDGETGLVRPPEPRALAAAIDALASDRREAARLGANAHDQLAALDLRWDRVAAELLR